MTVDTPFPERPGTPFWSPRGPMGMMGLGDVTPLTTTIDTALNDATQAYVATQQPTCPPGYVFNSAVGACQFANAVSGTVSASGNSGVLILLAIGAFFFLSKR